MSQTYIEPDYLVLDKKEKRSITKRLLLFPVLCLCLCIIMFVGESDVTSPLPSFTKCKYFFTANRIVGDLCDGDVESVMAHNLAYFDNGTINYVYYSGIQDIYDGGTTLLKEVYDTFLDGNLVVSFVGMPHAQYQTHLNKFTDEADRSCVWRSIGYIYIGDKDILQVDIQFLSPEIYYIFLTPTLPQLDESATEEEKQALEEYQHSPEYALLNRTHEYLNWVYNVASSQSEDTIKYIENIFEKHSLSAPLLHQFITRYFTNKGYYLHKDFSEEIESNYQHNLAWMFFSLAREVSVTESSVSYGMYNKTTKAISLSLHFSLEDGSGDKAQLTIPVFYTPAGYQIFADNIVYVADSAFDSVRVPQLITFLQQDVMPEDVLIERAAYERSYKR